MNKKTKQKLAKKWFIKLLNIICKNIEELEKEYGSNIKFKKNKWTHGEFRTIEGKIIEKGGVAFSNVVGKFPKEFAKKIPGTKNHNKFWSTGVSVVLHPKNPKIPAMHFNTRFICTKKSWFGGGTKKQNWNGNGHGPLLKIHWPRTKSCSAAGVWRLSRPARCPIRSPHRSAGVSAL